jgi:hypothetical protein
MSHLRGFAPGLYEARGGLWPRGYEVRNKADLDGAMREAFAQKDRLVFLDIFVDPMEHVYPMHVAPNGAMKDMWLSKNGEDLTCAGLFGILMENEPGALSRVVGLFSQRGYNIETLNVAPTDDHSLSRLTLTTRGDDVNRADHQASEQDRGMW